MLTAFPAPGAKDASSPFAVLLTKLVREIELPAAGPAVESVIYGNSLYGYFETRELTRVGNVVRVKLVPPGYRGPLRFWQRLSGSSTLVPAREQSFASPFPAEWRQTGTIQGNLSSPFFLLTIPISQADPVYTRVTGRPGSAQERVTAMLVVNRFGETVWIYAPSPVPGQTAKHASAGKALGDGRYGIVETEKGRGYFELFDYEGKRTARFDTAAANVGRLHHDWVLTSDNRLIAFTDRKVQIKRPWHFWTKSLTVVSSPVTQIELSTNRATVLWDYIDSSNPFRDPDWTEWISLRPSKQNPSKERVWEFMHANSIQEVPGRGYLISIRNLSKLVFLDTSFKKILWSIGSGVGNTYRPANAKAVFHRQHHATMLPDGRILMFDNLGQKRTRVVELELDERSKTVLASREFFEDTRDRSETRGSAFMNHAGNVVAYFTAEKTKRRPARSTLIEFDGKTTKEVGRMEVRFGIVLGYRGQPLDGVGKERFLGLDSPDSTGRATASAASK